MTRASSGSVLVAVTIMLLTAGCIADDPGESTRPPIEADSSGDVPVDGDGLAGAPIEPDVEVADLGFAEDGADPAPFDGRGLDIEDGPASATQSGLGPTESTVCLSIEVALDGVADGAVTDEAVAQRRTELEDRAAADRSIDRRLMSALRLSSSRGDGAEAALARAMSRCQELGYQR